jgi:hypothetical protein
VPRRFPLLELAGLTDQEQYNLNSNLGTLQHHPIQAIETRYRGWRFRSRLEARWAVFFESMEMDFHYESEGFLLQSGLRYLPDFFLPVINMWAEAKPFVATPEERRKAEGLVRESQMGCLWLIGPPAFRDYPGISWDSGDLTHCEYRLDIYEHIRRYYDQEHRLYACPGYPLTMEISSSRFRAAVYLSRAARFTGEEE